MHLSHDVGVWIAALLTLGIFSFLYKDNPAYKLCEQVHGTMLPLWVPGHLGTTIGNWFLIVGLLSTLVFFFFSKEHKGALGGTARLGVYFLMVSFGASYGYTVMARISLLIGRVMFLLHDWLGVLHL